METFYWLREEDEERKTKEFRRRIFELELEIFKGKSSGEKEEEEKKKREEVNDRREETQGEKRRKNESGRERTMKK